jgi:hypothetical protein
MSESECWNCKQPLSAHVGELAICPTAIYTPAPPIPPEPPHTHEYFDTLAARPDCLVAHHFRTQEDLDSVKTSSGGRLQPGILPVVYDPVEDAGKWAIDCLGTTTGGLVAWTGPAKWIPLGPLTGHGSVLITWEAKFDPNWKWVADGYIARHKMWWVQPNDAFGWNMYDTEWRKTAVNYPSRLGEAYLHCSKAENTWMVPGQSYQMGEIIMPRIAQFWFDAHVWIRMWHFVEGHLSGGIGGEPVYISAWAADHEQGIVQLYDRTPMYSHTDGLRWFKFGYDTSASDAINPYMESWNRNCVVLKDISLEDVRALLEAP